MIGRIFYRTTARALLHKMQHLLLIDRLRGGQNFSIALSIHNLSLCVSCGDELAGVAPKPWGEPNGGADTSERRDIREEIKKKYVG